jgi:PmbA protein
VNTADREALARKVLELTLGAGASAVEVIIREGSDFSASVRLQKLENLQQANYRRLGLRVFDGKRTAVSATSDFSTSSAGKLVSDALEMARAAGEDPWAGLPPPESYAPKIPDVQVCFPAASELPVEDKIGLASRCERAAFEADPRITNSEGAEFSDKLVHTLYCNSLGICSAYSKTTVSLSVTPLAESDGFKQRDYWLTTRLDLSRMEPPEQVGIEAAHRTLRRLGARKIKTCEVPIVLEPLAAAAVLKNISEAVSGTSIVRKASFLISKLGARVASRLVTIRDDALLDGGPGSRPFDAEGIPSQSTVIVREGVLESYLLDSYSGRKLGFRSTGNSNREPNGSPSVGPANFFLEGGSISPGEIIASVKRGLVVTELIGFGADIVSGNYSQGASGIWIENGQPAFPVEEVTIAGNLMDMMLGIEAVGDDLLALGEVFAPTVLIGKMIVSGS